MDEADPQTANPRLPIKTYHCRFCSHLLIASTRGLLSSSTPLKRRGGPPGLDRALILRLPAAAAATTPRGGNGATATGADAVAAGSASAGDDQSRQPKEQSPEGQARGQRQAQAQGQGGEQAHYTIPLSTLVPDSKPIVVRREDGFEKRVLLRCGRCRVVVGYELGTGDADQVEDEDDDDEEDDDEEDEDEDEYVQRKRRRDDKDRAIYLLPGSIVGTEDLEDPEGEGEGVDAMVERNAVLKGMEREWREWIK
jgi:hypothetical protein